MTNVKSVKSSNSIKEFLLNPNRINTVVSFLFGCIIANCTDFQCVFKSLLSLFSL